MPIKSKRPCTYPGCGLLTSLGRCEVHQAKAKEQTKAFDKSRGSSYSRGYGGAWLEIRKRILLRDKFACQLCKKYVTGKGQAHIDHVIPKAQGGTDNDNNLQVLCASCHSIKTAIEDGGYGR